MDPGTYFALVAAALLQCNQLQDRFHIIDFHVSGREFNTSGDLDDAVETFRSSVVSDKDLAKYGAVYFPNIRSTFNYEYDEDTVTIVHQRGGADGEFNGAAWADLPNAFQAKADLAINQMSIFLPPSGTVAGIYARVDDARGVWKAPANGIAFCS